MIHIDLAYGLILDKRFDKWHNILINIEKYFKVTPQLFLAGDGKTYHDAFYSHVDVTTKPPFYPNYSTTYATWWNKPHAYNAFLCHQKIIKKAIENNVNNVLILEDDLQIEKDFDIIFEAVEPNIPQNWDMIYFGAYHNGQTTKIYESPVKLFGDTYASILKVRGSAGFHCVLIKNTMFGILSQVKPLGPLDEICGKYLHNLYNCYAIYPSIVTQEDGYSYIEEQHLTKPDRYTLKCN